MMIHDVLHAAAILGQNCCKTAKLQN